MDWKKFLLGVLFGASLTLCIANAFAGDIGGALASGIAALIWMNWN